MGVLSGSRRVGNALGGSWKGALTVGSLLVLLFALIVALAATGRLGNPRYWSFPGHPYPPSGYYINPFNPQDKSDLVSSAEAARVKSDLLADGEVELRAVATSDPSLLSQSTAGNARTALEQVIAANKQAGILENEDVHITTITVGRLVDPNRTDVAWCLEEIGSGTITRVSQATGAPLGTQTVHFKNRFWLVRSGSRYLITDVLINTGSGS